MAAPTAHLLLLLGDPAAVATIAAHRRMMLYTLREAVVARPLLATRYDLLRYLHHAMAFDTDESLRAFFLDAARRLIAEEVVARGGPDAIAVEPRQVLTRALAVGAAGLILVHNHPGGDPAPSDADRRFTRRLATAGECLGVQLHDHLIVSRSGSGSIDVVAIASG